MSSKSEPSHDLDLNVYETRVCPINILSRPMNVQRKDKKRVRDHGECPSPLAITQCAIYWYYRMRRKSQTLTWTGWTDLSTGWSDWAVIGRYLGRLDGNADMAGCPPLCDDHGCKARCRTHLVRIT